MNKAKDIFEYITTKEEEYSKRITIIDGWEWSMKDHIKKSLFYKYGRQLKGNKDTKPVRNIVRPILNVAYRAEDIDLKDITLYVNDDDKYHLSFLVKKYHDEVFVRENDLDTFFDQVKEEKIDFGGALIKKTKGARPVKIPLQSIVFCDQTNIMAGPIGIKHYFNPDEIKEKESIGWGKKEHGATATIDEVIEHAESSKVIDKKTQKKSKTPGKYIEVYEVIGVLPDSFLKENQEKADEKKYVKQVQIVCFYYDKEDMKRGVVLFRKEDTEDRLKFISREDIYGRALGYGGVEELFEHQIWTNYGMIRMKDMLDSASKTILKTTDAAFANRNRIRDMENLEIAVLKEGADIGQIDTMPRNYKLFFEAVQDWENHAQKTGSATDPIIGEPPSSGTPFALQNLITQESHGIHEYRRGKYAKFIEEIYVDWIIPFIVKEITKEKKFLGELTQDELQYVADSLVNVEAAKFVKGKILNGELVFQDETEQLKQKVRDDFLSGGSSRFHHILEDELKDAKLHLKINVAGKQKNLALIVEKLNNVFKAIFSNPGILQDPKANKIFSKIIEYSGLDPAEFTTTQRSPAPQEAQPQRGAPAQNNQIPFNQLQNNQRTLVSA